MSGGGINNIASVEKDCYGCFACQNICPNNAIFFEYNNDGFLYPQINIEKCTNCGLCKNVCPSLVNNFNNNKNPKCFAFLAEDEIRVNCSSGGVFPILAKYFIDNKGYVAGAVWNSDATVSHIVSSDIEDIEKMKNSKYLQSNMGNCYSETKRLLNDNKLVLFTGTPCQIAGLKSFLKNDYENLYCVDIICHGVPSPKVFQKYIKETIEGNNEKWINTNFRSKENGWSYNSITRHATTNATINIENNSDIYMRGFLKNLYLRKTCTNCKFQTIPRQGDITIGDFWKISEYNTSLDDNKGTSAILINNSKGDFLFNILNSNAKLIKEVPIKHAIKGNPCLVSSSKEHKDRKLFFEQFNTKSFNENIKICIDDKIDYLIVNLWDSLYNYGALLTAYAMQDLVKSLGFSAKLLDTGRYKNDKRYINSYMETFAKKYLDVTKEYNSLKKCRKAAKNFKGIILGSDQVLRLEYTKDYLDKFLLSFADTNIRKIAISASFGISKEKYIKDTKKKDIKNVKKALSQFDFLSSRELSGKDIFSDIFNLYSELIIDPVFLIDREKYDSIAETSNFNAKNKIVSYILEKNEKYKDLYEYFEKELNASVEILDRRNGTCTVEDWLKAIRDCKLFITDSFHGVCFALIFNKPFICIDNITRGSSRLDSIAELFRIKEFIYRDINELYKNPINLDYDYTQINKNIAEQKERCVNLITNVLKNNYSNNEVSVSAKHLKKVSYSSKIELIKLFYDYTRVKLLGKIIKKKREHYNHKAQILKKLLRWGI